MRAKNVFVAATGQNVGKTTNCLGLFDRLRSRDFHVGFIKPVGPALCAAPRLDDR